MVMGILTRRVGLRGVGLRGLGFLWRCVEKGRELTLDVAASWPASSALFAAHFADDFPRRGAGCGGAAATSSGAGAGAGAEAGAAGGFGFGFGWHW